ncbi:MAG: 3-hydroxyacyl-CoA dehydrogenase NAD-binding domain-containing protein [Chitinophagaceae bacterium]
MVQTVCVCGAGTMGSGIAQVMAQSGFYTILYELNPGTLEKAKASIEQSLQILSEKKKITEAERRDIFNRIQFTSDTHHCLADIIIEAIIEKPAAKIALFNQLAEINHSETVFATNTSSLSVTDIAEKIMSPQRVIGMHFFNPPTIMKLVEVINTKFTDAQTTTIVLELIKETGKTAAVCKDVPGFIVNRVARPYYIESLRLIEEGITDFATIDSLLEATGFKMGPFKLMDLIGNDINYTVSQSIFEQLNKPERLRPSPIQNEKIANGELGKKSGRGYYAYPKTDLESNR